MAPLREKLEDGGITPPPPVRWRDWRQWVWSPKKAEDQPNLLAAKNHFIAMVGEYVGTVLFLFFALGATNVALIPQNNVTTDTTTGQDGSTTAVVNTSSLLYISLAFGFSLAVNAWIFFRVSGGLFNPAVSLGMVLVGAITPLRGVLLTFSQLLGGITGAGLIQAITPGTLNVRTTLTKGISISQGLFLEMFLTALLMLAILLLAAEKHKATFIAPVGIGLALFIAEMLGVYYTGGSLNPARSFGPCVVLTTFEHYHWIYWLGPALGAVIAAGFFKMLKYLQYETVLGPEADADQGPQRTIIIRAGAHDDEERTLGMPLAISGPGLEEVVSRESQRQAQHLGGGGGGGAAGSNDRGASNRDLQDRLDRIEAMLSRLGPQSPGTQYAPNYSKEMPDSPPAQQMSENDLAGRTSESTIVGNGNNYGHTHHANTQTQTRTGPYASSDVAGRPLAELGPRA